VVDINVALSAITYSLLVTGWLLRMDAPDPHFVPDGRRVWVERKRSEQSFVGRCQRLAGCSFVKRVRISFA
jgi:hypothetical protein